MATIQINLSSQDSARRDLTNTRQAIADINKQIAENARAITRSDEAGQRKLRTQNQGLAAERGLLRSVRESTSIKLAGLQMEQRAGLTSQPERRGNRQHVNRSGSTAKNKPLPVVCLRHVKTFSPTSPLSSGPLTASS